MSKPEQRRVAAIGDWRPRPGEPATLVVGSLADAQQWLGHRTTGVTGDAPAAARALREAGAGAVCLVEGADARPLVWLQSEHACGWLAAPRGMGCDSGNVALFTGQAAAAVAKGFVFADAAVLAMMACTRRPGADAQPDRGTQFVHDPALLPQLSWGDEPRFVGARVDTSRRLDLYGIVDSAERVQQVVDAGVRTVQLRIKQPPAPHAQWWAHLRGEIERSVDACRSTDAELFVNDHWQLAAELGAPGVHLGQEDLQALGEDGRAALLATGLALGISSHSLWELCRARALAPRYIACGPVWPTLTKAMPWIAQGLDNLAWWCRMAGAPVVAIGGVLAPEQVRDAARCGADGVCIVRGLGEAPRQVVPQLQAALEAGRRDFEAQGASVAWPHPSLSVA
jgi:thiamine-phosphate diphosphorylase